MCKHISCLSLGPFYLSSFLAKDAKGVLVISGHLGESTLLLGFGYQTYMAHRTSLLSLQSQQACQVKD